MKVLFNWEQIRRIKLFESTISNQSWYTVLENLIYQYKSFTIKWLKLSRWLSGIKSCNCMWPKRHFPLRCIPWAHVSLLLPCWALVRKQESRTASQAIRSPVPTQALQFTCRKSGCARKLPNSRLFSLSKAIRHPAELDLVFPCTYDFLSKHKLRYPNSPFTPAYSILL